MSIISYLKSTRAELAYIKWPSRKQVIWFTILVITVSIAFAYFLGGFDGIFAKLLQTVI